MQKIRISGGVIKSINFDMSTTAVGPGKDVAASTKTYDGGGVGSNLRQNGTAPLPCEYA